MLGLCTTACFKPQPDVACATRVVPRGAKGQSERKNKAAAQAQVIGPNAGEIAAGATPNVLLIMLDGVSRAQFKRALPHTHALLEEVGFTTFPHYAAVGDNSGPNQAALYSGVLFRITAIDTPLTFG